MGDDVCAPLEGTTVDWCWEGIIDDEGDTVLVSDACELLDVENLTARIADGLTKQCLGVRTECLVDFFFAGFLRDEGSLDAQLLQCDTKEVVGTTIYLIASNDMVACLADVEDGIEVSGLTRGC